MKKVLSIVLIMLLFIGFITSGYINNNSSVKVSENIENESTEKVKWVSFEEALKLSKKNPKKIFIDVYTTWCGWCKKMDRTTLQDSNVIKYLNKNFYSVRLDGETKDTIIFNGTPHFYNPKFKANELAVKLLDMRTSYPTTIYLDENFNRIGKRPGFLDTYHLLMILNYYGNNEHKKMTIEKYQKIYEENNKQPVPGEEMIKK